MKQVWKYNIYERPIEFWDYYDMLDDYKSLETSYNVATKEPMIYDEPDTIALNLICADLYEHYEHEKKYHIKRTSPLTRVVGYENLGGRKERLLNYCLAYMKKILKKKDFEKFTSFVRQIA